MTDTESTERPSLDEMSDRERRRVIEAARAEHEAQGVAGTIDDRGNFRPA